MATQSKLFPALLKYWRGRRGLSQLDLSLTAGVSARHISFLETGRSAPSEEMVMLLGGVLDVPLRDRNGLLRAAGFEARFAEPPLDALEDPAIHRAIERMMQHHEPFPMLVMDRGYDVLRMNHAGQRLFEQAAGGFEGRPNAFRVLFEQGPLRDSVVGWEVAAKHLIARLHRECLHRPNDEVLTALLDDILQQPGVTDDMRRPDFTRSATAVFPFRFRLAGVQLSFLTTVMKFEAPQNVTLDELSIESWFPMDDVTDEACRAWVQ